MDITIKERRPEDKKMIPAFDAKLGFGRHFSDHMFLMDYSSAKGWYNPRIEPYQYLNLSPAAMCLHYGQEIFEGMKAYRNEEGEIFLFRPEENIKRMNRSASRLVMPELDVDFTVNAIKKLVELDKAWIPPVKGYALYIRPTMIAVDPFLGVKPSDTYLFYVITGPVASYYPEQEGKLKAVKIYVTDKYVRAVVGGTGEAKSAGNYAASLRAQLEARDAGYAQVLWLDGVEHRYIEEVGTMNIFFVKDGVLYTSPLTGSILPGITRDSVIKLAPHLGYEVREERLTIDEVLSGIESGEISEVFGTGTAAIISPVSHVAYRDRDFEVGSGDVGPIAQRLYETLLGIQYGEIEDPFGWRVKLA